MIRSSPSNPDPPADAARLSPAIDALTQGSGGARAERLEVERARERISVPWGSRRAQRSGGLGLLALDAAIAGGLLFGLPFVRFEPPENPLIGWALVGALALGTFVFGGYRLETIRRARRHGALGAALGLWLGWLALKFLATKAGQASLTPPGALGLMGFTAIFGVWALASRGFVSAALRRIEARAKILFIGDPEVAAQLSRRLRASGLTNPLHTFVPPDGPGAQAAGVEALAALPSHLHGAVRAIVLAHPAERLSRDALAELIHCRVCNVPVLSPAQLVEEALARVPVLPEDPAWFLHDSQLYGGRSAVYVGLKRVMDVVGAAVGLVVALPILAAAAVAIRLTSRGPAFYRQVRTGLWSRELTIVKLRTMREDAERDGVRWAEPRDPRATPVGRLLRRTHVDELPQLWNVLKGDMSLVGPRPERPELNERLRALIPYYDMRHLVKPGITGWAQVRYPYGASVEDAIAKLEHDIYYVKHASLAFDARILWLTIGRVLGLRGR